MHLTEKSEKPLKCEIQKTKKLAKSAKLKISLRTPPLRYISSLHSANESQEERNSCPLLRSCFIGSCHVRCLKTSFTWYQRCILLSPTRERRQNASELIPNINRTRYKKHVEAKGKIYRKELNYMVQKFNRPFSKIAADNSNESKLKTYTSLERTPLL